MTELSIIIPYVQEWPTIVFTIRNLAEELRDRVDFEIIAIDNFCDQVNQQLKNQGKENDRAGGQLKAVMRGHSWLKALEYKDKLSHWQAKNFGVQNSSSKYLFFADAHCVISRDSLYNMFQEMKKRDPLEGTLHLPLTYHIMEYHKLIYKLRVNLEAGDVYYSFTPFRPSDIPYEVPCMSTCGLLMSRELYDYIGGWPTELGIYGGGESFINYTLAVLGKKKHIFPDNPLCHHGDNREYHWTGDDFARNICIATYMFGGKELALKLMRNRKGDQNFLMSIYQDVIEKCLPHRELIKSKQMTTIEEWLKGWM